LGCSGPPLTGRISRINFAVFSCATTSTVAGNSTLPPTWSKCVCVLMMVVTG
jgi:hypothetical protein